MPAWDRRTPKQLAAQREAALRRQVVDLVGPSSPWWRARFAALGRTAAQVATPEALAQLPAVGERDVCPDGDPAGAAGLVLQPGEAGFARAADGPRLRGALARRLAAPGSYRAVVEADTRPTAYVWGGHDVRFPVASTRGDLDLLARAGARTWQVLGLTRADVTVSALPAEPTAAAQALGLAALAAGAPLVPAGPGGLPEALRLVPATVLALPAAGAADLLAAVAAAGAPLAGVRTVLLVGAPYDDERSAARAAAEHAGARDVTVLGVHVPEGDRVLWAECRPSAGATGLHADPDLELLDLVDPETGERARGGGGARELVVTQLGLRGTALLRWRTGDLARSVTDEPCPACGRTVPRAVGVRRGALVPHLALRTGARAVDVRALTAALVGRGDVADWRVVVGRSARDGADELLVHVAARDAEQAGAVAVGVARDVRESAGLLPTQVVLEDGGALPGRGEPLTRRVLVRG